MMSSILFVCTGNLYRSPLAAACFTRKLQGAGLASGWTVESAGTWATPGAAAPSKFISAVRRFNIDLTGHVARLVNPELLARHGLIVVMEKGHREALQIEFPFVRNKVQLLSEVIDGITYDIPDPVGRGLEVHWFAAEFVKLMERGYRKIWEVAMAMQILSS